MESFAGFDFNRKEFARLFLDQVNFPAKMIPPSVEFGWLKSFHVSFGI